MPKLWCDKCALEKVGGEMAFRSGSEDGLGVGFEEGGEIRLGFRDLLDVIVEVQEVLGDFFVDNLCKDVKRFAKLAGEDVAFDGTFGWPFIVQLEALREEVLGLSSRHTFNTMR